MREEEKMDGRTLETQPPSVDVGPKPTPSTIDPRDPDHTREGIFVYHNCWKCDSGAKPCVRGRPSNCEYPHARND